MTTEAILNNLWMFFILMYIILMTIPNIKNESNNKTYNGRLKYIDWENLPKTDQKQKNEKNNIAHYLWEADNRRHVKLLLIPATVCLLLSCLCLIINTILKSL